MKKVWKVVSYILVAAIAASFGAVIAGNTVDEQAQLQNAAGTTKLAVLEQLLLERYIGETDSQTLTDGAAAGMVEALGDRWSYYMSAEEFGSYQQTMSNSFVGVGVTITLTADGSGLQVLKVTEGGPAQAAGIEPGDIITHAAGQAVADVGMDGASSLIKGEEGTTVVLKVLQLDENAQTLTVTFNSALTQEERDTVTDRLALATNVSEVEAAEETCVVTLTDPRAAAATREALLEIPGVSAVSEALQAYTEVELTVGRKQIAEPVATYQMLENNIGLVTIANFNTRCASETIAAIDALRQQGATSLILDVRNNGGGYVRELVQILDYLLPEGDLFISEDYTGKREVETSDAACLDIPMVVMVNANSYSAAEFFAAALREYEWATVVGQKTTGKGYFQTAIQFTDGSAVNLSIGKYFTPKGVSLAETGVTPDVIVEVDTATASKIYYGQLAPEEDPQIQAAIQVLLEEETP